MRKLTWRMFGALPAMWTAAFLLWSPARVEAYSSRVHGTSSGVEIRVESLLDAVPPKGAMPLRMTVRNRSDRKGTWTFLFFGEGHWRGEQRMSSSYEMEVDAGDVKTVAWNVPVFPATAGEARLARLYVTVSGPGSEVNRQMLFSGGDNYSGNRAPSFVGLSEEVARRLKVDLENRTKKHNRDVAFTTLDATYMPEDAEGLSGLDVIVMTGSEWQALSVYADTFRRWLAAGGHLILLGESSAPEFPGMGKIHALEGAGPDGNPSKLLRLLQRVKTSQERLADPGGYLKGDWELRGRVPEIRRPFGVLMSLVVIMAALLGPLNLWWAFRRKRVMQLIWTTPAISLGLSLMVGVGILFGDGFGGAGHRALQILLLPEQRLEVKQQEQVSRTGVLWGGGFTLPPGVSIYPVKVNPGDGPDSERYMRAVDGSFGGDWFANRRIQGQVLRQVRSSRARVAWIDGEGGAPSLRSTVDAPLTRVWVRDASGGYWTAENVVPGREATLRRGSESEARAFLESLRLRKESVFPPGGTEGNRGWFYAEAGVTEEAYIDTLRPIRWTDEPVHLMGPLVGEGGGR